MSSTLDTTANGGNGRKPGKVPGALNAAGDPAGEERGPWTSPMERVGFREGSGARVASGATRTSDVFYNADGSVTVKVSTEPLNFMAANGQWTSIDPRLVRTDSGQLRTGASEVPAVLAGWRTRGGMHEANEPADTEPFELARMTFSPEQVLGYELQGARRVEPTVSGALATYRGILPRTDLSSEAFHGGVRQTLVLRSADAASSWAFPLRLTGLTARQSTGGVEFLDPAGKRIAFFGGGVARDDKGASTALVYELANGEGGPVVKVTVNGTWLRDPARVYPVRVSLNASDADLSKVSFPAARTVHAPQGKRLSSATLRVPSIGSAGCSKETRLFAAVGGRRVGKLAVDGKADGCGRADMPLDPAALRGWASGEPLELAIGSEPKVDDTFAAGAATLVVTFEDNIRPEVDSQYPPNGFAVPTLTPELTAIAQDIDAYPSALTLTFQVYDKDSVKIADSGAIAARSWSVPSGILRWGETYVWTVIAFDGNLASTSQKMNTLATPVPQPNVTSGLSQNGEKGFNPQVGNYTTSAMDVQVPSAGPVLSIQRFYNSLDPRTGLAFGAGWATLLDAAATQRVDPQSGQVQTVVVTYPTGQEVAFGRNADNTFTPPSGRFATFRAVTGGYELVDKEGTKYTFTQPGASGRFGLTSITDAQGRVLTLQYTAGKPSSATSTSGRKLSFTWVTPAGASAAHVESVRTDELEPGNPGSASVWSYEYSGDSLVKACPATSTVKCTTYAYGDNSLYPSTVLNLGSRHYWRLGEADEGDFTSVINSNVDREAMGYGYHRNTQPGQPGALPGSTATATRFDGVSSHVWLSGGYGHQNVPGGYQSVSMWFKTSATSEAVLYSVVGDFPTGIHPTTQEQYAPVLFIGNDGKLSGRFPTVPNPGPLGKIHRPDGGKCVDTHGGALINGEQLELFDCTPGRQSQDWTLDSQSRLSVTKAGVTKCAGWLSDWWGSVVLDNCGTGAAQKWQLRANGDVCNGDGFCWQTEDLSDDVGAHVELSDYYPNPEDPGSFVASPPVTPIRSGTTVNDGGWHHVLLAAAGGKQTLYLDGVWQGELVGAIGDWTAGMPNAIIGAGYLGRPWPNQSKAAADGSNKGTAARFNGSIGEVAFFERPLPPEQVAELYAARRVAKLLKTVTRPGGGVSAQVTYDNTSGQVSQVVDAHSGVWQLGKPHMAATGEQYAAAVLGGEPIDYYRLGETGATKARDEVNGGEATYNQVTLGYPSDVFPDTKVASFDGLASYVRLPARDIPNGATASVSMWIRRPISQIADGVLLGYQSAAVGESSVSSWHPALYIGTDGKLRGEFWTSTSNPVTTTDPIVDGLWHHVALTASAGAQTLYLDGVKVGTRAGGPLTTGAFTHAYLGAGKWAGRPATVGDNGYFSGQMSEVAFFRTELTEAQVSAQYAARVSEPFKPQWMYAGAGSGQLVAGPPAEGDASCWDALRVAPTGDFNGDGYRDTICATDSGYFELYRGNGAGGHISWSTYLFTPASAVMGVAAPGDFDGDAKADILYTDRDGVLWLARGSGSGLGIIGSPTQIATGWGGREIFSPGDFDGDGKGDLLYVARADQALYLMRGNGSGGWLNPSPTLLASGWAGRAVVPSWGDFDGDTKADVLFSRSGDDALYLLRGNGTGGFLPGGPVAVVQAWTGHQSIFSPGDWTGDGKADVIFTTSSFIDPITEGDEAGIPLHTKKVTVTDPGGKQQHHIYDVTTGKEVTQVDVRGGVTRYTYDTSGFLRSTTDPNGNVTIEEHDIRGNVIAKTTCQDWSENKCSTVYTTYYPDATTKVLTPDPRNDMVLTVRDGRSASPTDDTYKTTFTYDTRGNRIQVTDPLGRSTVTDYTDGTTGVPAGLPWRVTAPGGGIQTVTYYPNGDVQHTVDTAGLTTDFVYDALGRPSSKTTISDAHPAGLTTTFTYDKAGRPLTQTEPPVINRVTGATHTAVTTSVYDLDGQVTSQSVADTTGGDATRTVTNAYNTRGQLESMTDARGKTRTFAYDAYGNKVLETDPTGAQLAYAFDATGQQTTTTVKGWTGDPNFPSAPTDLVIESRAYDPAGRLASITDAMGWVTLYTYTDNGLTAAVSRKDPSSGATFAVESNVYDAAGNLISQKTNNGAIVTNLVLDAAGRLTSQTLDPTGVNRTTEYTYAPDDTVLTVKVSDGTGATHYTDATYDVARRKTSESIRGAVGGPMGWWKADETSGTTAADASAAHRTMTLQGSGLSWSDGALDLNGSGSLQTSGPVIDNTQSITVAAWVRITDLGDFRTVVAQDGQHTQGFSLQYNQNANRWALWKSSHDSTSPAQQAMATSAAPPQVGLWTHLVGVYDAASATMKLYVNGQLEGTATAPPSHAATGPLVIGRGNWDGPCAYFKGSIDNVQVYQRAIGDADAQALYTAGRTAQALTQPSVTRWTFDQRGLATTTTDPNGHITGYQYDEAARPTITTAPAVNAEENGATPELVLPITTVGYDTFGGVVQTRDAKGRVTTQVHDAAGQVTETHLPAYTPPGSSTPIQAVTKTVYDDAGQAISSEDPLHHITTYLYDQLGRIAKATTPDTGERKFTHSLNGDQLSQTDPLGARTEITYDYLGRKLTSTQIERTTAQAYTTTFGYDTAGRLATVTPPGLAATTYEYNAAGETTKVTDGAGKATSTQYDLLGRPTTTLAADGTRQVVTYNPIGNPVSRQELDASSVVLRTTSASFDPKGQQVTSTDGRGTTISFTYDATGMVTQVVQPTTPTEAITTTFGYDLSGSLTRFTDGRGSPFVTTYNTWNKPESQIEPGGATFTVAYDAAGRPVTSTSPGGVSVTNSYDEVGNLTGQTGAGADAPTAQRTFGYDLANRLTSAQAGSNSLNLTYNDRGLPLTTSGAAGSSTFTYTPAGMMASRQDAAGTSSYTYDAAGRLATIADASTGAQASIGYNDISQVTSITHGSNGNKRILGYDPLHRLTSDDLQTPGGTSIAKIVYGYDLSNNEISKATTGFGAAATNSYTYDLANRLVGWNDGTIDTAYTYDKSGNRTSIGSRVFTYDARNQLTSDGDATYSYTPRGTLTGTTVGTVTTPSTFDSYGQQISQDAKSYTYDGLGRLITTSSGESFSYTGASNDLAADGTATYSRDPGGVLIGTKTGSTGVFSWTDLHTDVVAQFTSTGTTLTGSRTYNPLGVITATAGLVGNLGYQSGWTDPQTSRVNMHARWYNPGTAQFASRDTAGVSPIPNSMRANRFAYGDGNPLTVTDPTGHWGLSTLKNAFNKVTQAVSNVVSTVSSAVSSAYNWARDRVDDVRDYVTEKVNQAKTWVTTQVAKVTQKVKTVVNKVKQKVTSTVNTVKQVAATVYSTTVSAVTTAVQATTNFVQNVVETTTKVVETAVQRTTRLIEEGKQAIVDAYKATETWVKEHKAEIAGFVVGAVVGIGCGIAIGWTGVGAVACGVLAGAAGAAVTGAMQGKTGWDLVGDIAAGALIGGITGGLGSMIGSGISAGIRGLVGGGVRNAASKFGGAFMGEGKNILSGLRNPGNVFGKAGQNLKNFAQNGTSGLRNLFGKGCPVPGHSFDPKTPVLMADGTIKAIGAIAVGDKVLAADPKSGRTEAKSVTTLHINNDHDLTTLKVRNAATGVTSTLKTTQHHPFWDTSANVWVNAADLKADSSKLTGPNGKTVEVLAVVNHADQKMMRDLTVDDLHTYYVLAGDQPVLVHNCGDVALGLRSTGTKSFAESRGFDHFMDLGKDEWRGPALDAVTDSSNTLHVNMKGFIGDFSSMVRRGLGPNPYATEEEMSWIARMVANGHRDWSSIKFYGNAGERIGIPEPDWSGFGGILKPFRWLVRDE